MRAFVNLIRLYVYLLNGVYLLEDLVYIEHFVFLAVSRSDMVTCESYDCESSTHLTEFILKIRNAPPRGCVLYIGVTENRMVKLV